MTDTIFFDVTSVQIPANEATCTKIGMAELSKFSAAMKHQRKERYHKHH